MNGDIILPDTFTDPQTNRGSSAFVPFNQSEIVDGYEDNIYSGSDWDAMESAGAVFLPAAGVRMGNAIQHFGNMSEFWTTTSNQGTNTLLAYRAHMNTTKTAEAVTLDKYYGCPVRLVTDVK